MNKMSKILLAHPGRQHSYRLASALKKNGMLLGYCTTIYDKRSSFLMKTVKKFLSKDDLKRANGRKNPDLVDADVIQYCEFGGMLEAFLIRVDKRRRLYFWVQRFNARRFGKRVAKLAIKEQADAVIAYDTAALACFQYLKEKAPHILRIMDVSHAPRTYEAKLFETYDSQSGKNDLRSENHDLWDKQTLSICRNEIALTDQFLVASSFVEQALQACGVSKNQIKIVPYGANVQIDCCEKSSPPDNPLRFLFVGQVNARKGVPILLETFSRLDNNTADLTLTGAYDKNSWYMKQYFDAPNIHFTGLVTQDKLAEIYCAADVFVLDSFAEGMAQVGIEAMACGLPIICSQNSGVNDMVEEGENGFVIPCGDAKALQETMQWFIDHSDRIPAMGKRAHETAGRYTWQQYEKNVCNTLRLIIEEKNEGKQA